MDYYTLEDLLAHWERGEIALEELIAHWPREGMSNDELLREILRALLSFHKRLIVLESKS